MKNYIDLLQLALKLAESSKIIEALKIVNSVEIKYPKVVEVKTVRALILQLAGREEDAKLAAEEALLLSKDQKDSTQNNTDNFSSYFAKELWDCHIPNELITDSNDGALLALTGNDWKQLSKTLLQELNIPIKAILALDDDAIMAANSCGIPWYVIEDFIEQENLVSIIEKSLKLRESWFSGLKNFYTSEKIVWPELDQESLDFFWLEALIATEFVQCMHNKKQKLIVTIRTPYAPPLYYYAHDIFGRVCTSLKSEFIFSIGLNSIYLRPPYKEEPIWPEQQLNFLNGGYVCVINSAEIFRSKDILLDLYEKYHDRFFVIALGGYNGERLPMPIIPLDISLGMHDDENIFSMAWKELQNYELLVPSFLKSYILKSLQFYHLQRWPSLRKIYLKFYELFRKYRPKKVFGTDLPDAESQLAFAAANSLEIDTIAWGHSHVMSFRNWKPCSAKKLLVSTKYNKFAAKYANVPDERVIDVYGINRDILYPAVETSWPKKEDDHEVRILVLPRIVKFHGTSCIRGDMRFAEKVIGFLCDPPKIKNKKLCMRFKVHPWHPVYSPLLLQRGGERLIFPNSSNLELLLSAADICIAFSEIDCALLHASKCIPTILLLQDKICRINPGTEQAVSNMYPNICSNYLDIWKYVEKIIFDKQFAKSLLEKQKEFCSPVPSAVHYLDAI